MKETILSIAKWHEKTFPDATLEGQLQKYQEEQHEWVESDYTDITELADMFIVACGIARFDIQEGVFYMYDIHAWLDDNGVNVSDFIEAVQKKMEKNRKRVWNKTDNGTYHHENGIED